MGRWTSDRFDVVLRAKMKCLITGTIERQKLERVEKEEKAEPTITYESFVEELDTGDSFTAQIIDILVKELADKRTRITEERKAISESTVRRLRTLSVAHVHVPRERSSFGSRRLMRRPSNVNLSEFLIEPPETMTMDEDDDDFETMLDSAGEVPEGSRINSDLFDAYSSSTHNWSMPPLPRIRRSHTFGPRSDDDTATLNPPPSPPSTHRMSPWTAPPGGSLPLSRQLSIRRSPNYQPPRDSRTADFNDFTSSRRSAIRQSSLSEPREPPFSRGSMDRPGREPSPYDYHVVRSRRFFPSSRFRDVAGPEASSPVDETGASSTFGFSPPVHDFTWDSNTSLPPFPTPSASTSSQDDSPHEEEIALMPASNRSASRRLRRGGVRAPESMLSRHASPTVAVIRMPPSPVSEPLSPPPTTTPISQNQNQEDPAEVPAVSL